MKGGLMEQTGWLAKVRWVALFLAVAFAAEVKANVTNEVWIAANAVAATNTGTREFPLDGSTREKFDALMARLTRNSNIVIRLSPGTFRTAGGAWYLRSDTRLLGSGKTITTIKLPDNARNVHVVESVAGANNVEVADLTLDANGQNTTNKQILGMVIWGTNSVVRRVRVQNLKGDEAERRESFGIRLVATDAKGFTSYIPGFAGVISECEVSSMQGNYISAMLIYGKGVMERCQVYFPRLTNVGKTFFGYTAAGECSGIQILNNYLEGGLNGVHIDTGGVTNLVIAGNHFHNVVRGINLHLKPDMGAHTIIARDNIIELNPTFSISSHYTMGMYFTFDSLAGANLVIRDNTIKWSSLKTSSNGSVNVRAIQAAGVTGVRVNHNSIDAGMSLMFYNTPNLTLSDNFDLEGNLFTGRGRAMDLTDGLENQVASANSIKRRTTSRSMTLTLSDYYVGVTTTDPITIQLPSAAGNSGKEFVIGAEVGRGVDVTLDAFERETINGATTKKLKGGYEAVRLISNGANGWVAYE